MNLKQLTPLKYFWILFGGFLSILVLCLIYVAIVVSHGMPSLEQLENPKQNYATRIYSADGVLLDHYFIQKRVWVSYDSIPSYFFNALVSVEDKDFYHHWGMNSSRILKALFKNVLFMDIKGGASTITQQLSRGMYYNMDRTISRKIREAFTAIQIERTYTKEEILELYANTVAFGRGAYGIQVASQVYFDKSPIDLSLAECAFLVGLLQRPERYNGQKDYVAAVQRRNYVLKLMEDNGKITPAMRADARRETLAFKTKIEKGNTSLFAPHFVEMIRQDVAKDIKLKDRDLYRDGLVIYTTLDSRIQKLCNAAVDEYIVKLQQKFNSSFSWNSHRKLLRQLLDKAVKDNPDYTEAGESERSAIRRRLLGDPFFVDSVKNAATTVQVGLNVIDQQTGAILGMVGASPKFMKENPVAKYSLNHAAQIHRQPGSTFKPFVYASAMENGLNMYSSVASSSTSLRTASGKYWYVGGRGGYMSLASALQASVNAVAARLITQYTSPSKVIELAKKMGIESPLQAVPALGLGAGGEVTPLEMTSAYTTFASEGLRRESFYVTRIEDQFGNTIYEHKKNTVGVEVLSQNVAQQMIKMMRGVVDGGTGWHVKEYFPDGESAGKTGTTNNSSDVWFIGYTPQLTAGVWIGFDDRRVNFEGMGSNDGGHISAPLWGLLMSKIYSADNLPYKQKRFAAADSNRYALRKLGDDSTASQETPLPDGSNPNSPDGGNKPNAVSPTATQVPTEEKKRNSYEYNEWK